MSYQNEPAGRRQTYKLGYWQENARAPRLGDFLAVDHERPVGPLKTAIQRARERDWVGVFEPVWGGWE